MNIAKQEMYVYFCLKRFSKYNCKVYIMTITYFYTHLFLL